MSLWADYKKEREGVLSVEKDWGFVTYLIADKECYIQDVYIRPEDRRKRGMSDFGDEVSRIAIEAGCDCITGTVAVGSNGDTESVAALIKYGMRLDSVRGNIIVFYKKLGE